MNGNDKFDFAEFFGFGSNGENRTESNQNAANAEKTELFGNTGESTENKAEFDLREIIDDRGDTAEGEDKKQRVYDNDDIVSLSDNPDSLASRRLAKESSSSIYGSGVSIAVENDWLELSYTGRNYVHEENDSKPVEVEEQKETEKIDEPIAEKMSVDDKEAKGGFVKGVEGLGVRLGKKGIATAALAVIVILAAICAFTVGGVDAVEWWSTVKREAMGVFGIEARDNKVVVSAISTVDSVANGDIVIKGGSLALTFAEGTVKNVTDSSVTVEYSSDTEITYNMLKDIKVVSGQILSCYDILGYYDEAYTVNIYCNGKKVENVAVMGNSIVWEV